MSIWEDVDDGFGEIQFDHSGNVREAYLPIATGLDQEMPPMKISATDLTVTLIEEDGQIIGVRLSGIHGVRPEENFHTNMRLEEDGEDIILYDKEWAAIHEDELEIILNCNGEEPDGRED